MPKIDTLDRCWAAFWLETVLLVRWLFVLGSSFVNMTNNETGNIWFQRANGEHS